MNDHLQYDTVHTSWWAGYDFRRWGLGLAVEAPEDDGGVQFIVRLGCVYLGCEVLR